MKRLFEFAYIAIILIVVHFLLSPIIKYGVINSFFIKVNGFSRAKDYYSVLSSISSVLVGWSGVGIGYFYYINRKNHDRESALREKIEGKINSISNKLTDIWLCLCKLFSNDIKGIDDLNSIRAKITTSFDDIVMFIENNEEILSKANYEMRDVIEFWSYIEQSEVVMNYDCDRLRRTDLSEVRATSSNLFRNAKECCVKCLSIK